MMHRQAMDHGMRSDGVRFPTSALSPECSSSKGCGQRNYKRSLMLLLFYDVAMASGRQPEAIATVEHEGGFERQDDDQLRKQAGDTVERGGAGSPDLSTA
ncbi:hypothetical protein [Hydrogenophaga electricum]|uniref:hypothetical protein n=1 Tax=Hydrogenophaga electricum TaxID=1230953 RepID=UPI00351A09B1